MRKKLSDFFFIFSVSTQFHSNQGEINEVDCIESLMNACESIINIFEVGYNQEY